MRKMGGIKPDFLASIFGFAFSLGVSALISLSRDDIRFWDESMYLERGATLAFGTQLGWSWNPLYTDGYWILRHVFTSNIDAYFAGRAIAAMLVVGAVWLSVRFFANARYAMGAALVMALLPITYVWPSVSAPSAALLVLALAVTWRWPSPIGTVAAGVLTWLAAAIRPEFVWAATVVSAIIIVALIRAKRTASVDWRQFWGSLIGLASIPILLIAGYGNPWNAGTRSWEAFGQHFEYRFATSGDDPWQIDAPVLEQTFPGASSVLEAFVVNPQAFLEHVARNVLQLPISLAGHLMGLGGSTERANLFGVMAAGLWLLAIAVGMLQSRRSLTRHVKHVSQILTARNRRVPGLISIAVLAIAGASMLTIYPRPHYLLFFVALIVVVSGISLGRLLSPKIALYLPLGALIVLSILALVFSSPQADAKINANSLRELNSLNVSWRLLTPEEPIDIYLDDSQYVIAELNEQPSFIKYITANNVNVIFDGVLLRQAPYAQLPGFEEFLSDPESYGFAPVLPNSPFLVRTESP